MVGQIPNRRGDSQNDRNPNSPLPKVVTELALAIGAPETTVASLGEDNLVPA